MMSLAAKIDSITIEPTFLFAHFELAQVPTTHELKTQDGGIERERERPLGQHQNRHSQ